MNNATPFPWWVSRDSLGGLGGYNILGGDPQAPQAVAIGLTEADARLIVEWSKRHEDSR
jgi:hypothetical protein